MLRVAGERDRRAFMELFDHYAPRVKGYLRRLGVDGEAAEDLVQDVMLTVWQRAETYDPRQAGVSTWIFTIARNRRIDVIRRERRPEPDPDDPLLVPDAEPFGEAIVLRAETDRRLRAAVASLPEDQATLVRVSFFEEKPHGRIAKELGLPLGTVKSRIRLALGKLRSVLAEQ
ncbi:MAG: sigma-70 family RNA polymerase sigma factor [Geminicoccaceae bacterium]